MPTPRASGGRPLHGSVSGGGGNGNGNGNGSPGPGSSSPSSSASFPSSASPRSQPPVDTYFYEVLGIAAHSTEDEIKRGYRKQALLYHPDKNPGDVEAATVRFKLVAEAYATLIDPLKRQAYDQYGRGAVRFDEQADNGGGGGGARGGASGDVPVTHSGGGGGGGSTSAFYHPHVSRDFADNLFRHFFDHHAQVMAGFADRGLSLPFATFAPQAQAQARYAVPQPPQYAHQQQHQQQQLYPHYAPQPQVFQPPLDPFAGFPNIGGALFDRSLMLGGLGMGFGGGFGSGLGGNLFGAGFGGAGAGELMSGTSSSSSYSSSGGMSQRVETTTTVVNGVRTTRTTRTVRHSDGREERTSDERVEHLNGGAVPPYSSGMLENRR